MSCKLSFLVLSHQAGPQLHRLARALRFFPNSCIFWHHDSYQSALPSGFFSEYGVQACSKTLHTEWGRVSVMKAELALIKDALERSDADWLVFLTSACYPIKSASHIVSFLSSSTYDAFLDINETSEDPHIGLPFWWYRKTNMRCVARLPWLSRRLRFYLREIHIKNSRSPFRAPFKPRYGSQSFIFNRKTASLVDCFFSQDHSFLPFVEAFEAKRRIHFSSEECLFQTILPTLPSIRICPNDLRYIDWKNSREWHPNILTDRHTEAIFASDALFARKFSPTASESLLTKLDHRNGFV